MKARTNEHVRVAIPGALKIRFGLYGGSLRVKISVKDSHSRISVDIEVGNAVWISRHQEFTGEGSEVPNQVIRNVTNFLIDTYKEKWADGPVTADMLKVAYEYEFHRAESGLSKREVLLKAKEKLLNNFETSIQKPMRSRDKVSAFEKMLADVNQRLAAAEVAEEVEKEEFNNRVLVRKTPRRVSDTFDRVVRHRIKIRFQLRRSRLNKAGLCPIDCHVRVNGVPANPFSINMMARPKDWDCKLQAIMGDEEGTSKLRSIYQGLEAVFREFRSRGRVPQPEEIIAHYFDHELEYDKKWTVAELVDVKIKDLLRLKRSKPTIMKYRRVYTLFQSLVPIVLVEDIKRSHILEFHEHMKSKGQSQNYTNKCVRDLHGLFALAVEKEIIDQNPAKGTKFEWENKVNLTCLNDDEIKALKTKEWSPTLQGVVDSFLFMCYTGLHITDYLKLKNSDVHSYQGQRFIEYSRQKNDQVAMVPLGSDAMALIDKYGSVEALPRISAQKQNDHLKLIAAKIGTNKVLTNKVARKTFTDMSINKRGMSFEAVAGMLGHASTNFVKVYGRVRHNRILAEWRG